MAKIFRICFINDYYTETIEESTPCDEICRDLKHNKYKLLSLWKASLMALLAQNDKIMHNNEDQINNLR
jgi:hypothetical protein